MLAPEPFVIQPHPGKTLSQGKGACLPFIRIDVTED